MKLFKRRQNVQSERMTVSSQPANSPYRLAPNDTYLESGIYDNLRACVPIIDACFGKIVRLTGDFKVVSEDERFQTELDKFCREVTVGISGKSIYTFADMYLDSLLTYGKAIGRIYAEPKTRSIRGLAVGDSSMFRIRQGRTPLDKEVIMTVSGREVKINSPEQLLYTTLNPTPKHPDGVSILRGLPAISSILMRIYECIGQNFDRVGNVRYAVTYKPSQDGSDKMFAKERAMEIAREWSDGMNAARHGNVKDFVAVGDVGIKVIGAENQLIDTEIPVRQLLEQLVSKLSVPPFLLGLNWSTTERMSSQQADILTSELEYYRRLLTPVLTEICTTFLRLCGTDTTAHIEWANINLQDEEALAKSRLYNAQAKEKELQNEKEELNGRANSNNR